MKNVLASFILLMFLSSCDVFESKGPLYFSSKKNNSDAIVVKPSTPEEKIAKLQEEFFNVQCIRCHNPERPNRLDLTVVENLDSHFDEILFRVTEAFKDGQGQMPPRGEEASEAVVKLYTDWKKDQTYLSLQKNFLAESCLRCHNSDRPNRLDLALEKNIIENYDDILYRVTEAHDNEDGKMPPRGKRPTEEQIQLLKLYKKLADQ